MTYRHPYTTTFYNGYTLISVIIVKSYCYICMSSIPFSELTWILGVRMLSEHSNAFEILEVDKACRFVAAI